MWIRTRGLAATRVYEMGGARVCGMGGLLLRKQRTCICWLWYTQDMGRGQSRNAGEPDVQARQLAR